MRCVSPYFWQMAYTSACVSGIRSASAMRKRRVHAVPTVVHRAAFASAGAAAGIRHRRTRDVHHGRHGHLRQGEDRFALRVADVVIHHVARAQHHRHAQRAGGVERLVHARHDGIDAHGRRLAPVKVPDIHGDDADVLRIDLLGGQEDLAGGRVAGLEGELDFGSPHGAGGEQTKGEKDGNAHRSALEEG